jgi:general secretion pathway protein G
MRRSNEKGFTLIEIMVVVIILGILASIVAVKYSGQAEKAKQTQAAVQMKTFETALELYKLENGMYPSTEQGLQALVEAPTVGVLPKKWRTGGYLAKKKVPTDPWQNEYIYLSPGTHGDFDIASYGSDGQPAGEGEAADINNWDVE